MSFGFEAAEQADDEWIVGKRQDVALRENLIHLIAKNHVAFTHLLHSETLFAHCCSDKQGMIT